MADNPIKGKIRDANEEVVRRITAADPVLVDIAPAGDVIPGLEDRMVLHAGPPVSWSDMSGAQKGAVIGNLLHEGWASNAEQATELLRSGEIKLEPNHHHQAVGPMSGTISRSMWVFVVENAAFGNKAFCRQVEPAQQFGDYSPEALAGLERWDGMLAPALRAALRTMKEGLKLRPIITKALQMGDELHNRPNAATSLFANEMAVPLVQSDLARKDVIGTLAYLAAHYMFFLGLSMPSAKCAADAARGVEYSTIVTAMARNGTEFGIQVSGLDGEWFTAPAPPVKGLFLPGFRESDAGRDTGDSAITETVGWGGFALAGAPGLLSFVGGTPDEARAYSIEMRRITAGRSPDYLIPALGFEGTAVGIDIRKVVQENLVPVIDTAMIHKDAGHPIIGGGIVRPPLACFAQALRRFGEKHGLG